MKTNPYTHFGFLASCLVFLAVARLSGSGPSVGSSLGPNRSSPIAISISNLLVCVNPDTNTVTLFDANTATPSKLAEIVVGREPSSVAISPDGGIAYVANALDGTVSVVDLADQMQVALVNAGAEPLALALSPNGTKLYVANSASDSVMVFNATTLTPALIATIDLSAFGSAPRAIAITDDGDADDFDETIFVTLFYGQLRPGKTFIDEGQDNQRQGHVVAISSATDTVVGAPNPVALGPIANTGFNANGQLAPGNGLSPAVSSTNPQTFTTPTAAFPNQLVSIAIHPTTQTRAYVLSTAPSPNGPARFNHNVHGLVSVFDTSTRTEITAGQTGSGVRQTAPLNLNQGVNLATTPAPRLFNSNPTALAWRPDGSDAWIAVQESDVLVRMTIDASGIPTIAAPLVAGPSTIVRVDLQSGAIPGKAPRGVTINAAGSHAYVFNYISRSVSVVDISNPTAPAIVASVQSTALPPTNTLAASVHLGAELFHSGRGPDGRLSSEGWGSCASCHPNGRADNVTWMFDGGPRQTIALDGIFGPTHQASLQRILNWSATRDEVHDFEVNTRNVSGGRGLIDDDRLFFAVGGNGTPIPIDYRQVEQFHQFTGVVGRTNDLTGTLIPYLPDERRDFAMATLADGRVFIIGGRAGPGPGVLAGPGQGALITGPNTVLEFNTRSNSFHPRSAVGFTLRHSLGAAVVRTSAGPRIYAIGGYASVDVAAQPVFTVEEYNPATDTWRTVASLITGVAQFGITVAGGINTAEPLQLIHVVLGNTGSEGAPVVVNAPHVQRFQADPAGPGTWTPFALTGITLRRNHGVAAALRGTSSRVFIIGGQDAAGTVLDTVQEYVAQSVALVATPHTSLPAPRASFGIASTLSSQQIYVVGGINGVGADQSSVLEYSIANNGPVAGPPGTPSGSWVTRGNLMIARRGLQLSSPPGVVNLLPFANTGRSKEQDALAAFMQHGIRPAKGHVPATDPSAMAGRVLFGTVGLSVPGFSCVVCHGGQNWTRSLVDYTAPPSPETGLGLGNERVIGAELRQTATQRISGPTIAPGVLLNVGTFALNTAGGRVNEIRANGADIGQAVAPLGANGFNIPSLLSVHETAPYFYSGLAQTLEQVLDGSADTNGGQRVHFIPNAAQRADLVAFLRSIDETTPPFGVVPPTLVCPADIVTNVPPGAANTVVTWAPLPTTGVPAPTVTCVPPNGSVFGIGTTVVNCTASNSAGTTNCSFFVTVASGFVITKQLGTLRNNFSGLVGFKFTVGPSNFLVLDLGRIVVSGNTGVHQVKLVRASDLADVPGGSVNITTAGGVPGEFKYAPLPMPVLLQANTMYYLATEETAGGDFWYDLDTSLTTWPIAVVNSGIFMGSGYAWSPVNGNNHSYGPIDFRWSVGVAPAPQPPSVTITNPIEGAMFTAPANILVQASASAGVVSVEFFNGAQSLGVDSTSPFSFALNNAGVGNYQLRAVATDGLGVMATSAPVNITVNASVPGAEVGYVTSSQPGLLRNNFTGLVGMKITVGPNPIPVTALGRMFFTGNSGMHTVKIVRASDETDVPNASVVVNLAGGGVNGQFIFVALSQPVTLAANTVYFVVTSEQSGGDLFADLDSRITTTDVAVQNSPAFSGSGFPWTTPPGPGFSYGLVSFRYQTAGGPLPPTVTLTNPPAGSVFVLPTNILLQASASAGVTNVEFFSGVVKIGEDSMVPFNFNWIPTVDGQQQLTARAKDTNGLTGTSPIVAITLTTNPPGSELAFVRNKVLGATRNNFGGVVGMKITVGSSPIRVTRLGRIVAPGNTGVHQVKFVDAISLNDVPGGSVSIATTGQPVGEFAYAPLAAPITLLANTMYFLVSAETSGGDLWHDVNGTALITANVAAINSGIFNGSGFGWSQAGTAGHSYGPVDFFYEDVAMPVAFSELTTSAVLPLLFCHSVAGKTRLSLLGEPGRNYIVETSNDLKNWSVLGGYTAGAGTLIIDDYRDAGAAVFYRARLLEK